MCAAGAFRGVPASITATLRRARPKTMAALRPAAPPPMTTTSYDCSPTCRPLSQFLGLAGRSRTSPAVSNTGRDGSVTRGRPKPADWGGFQW